MAHPKNDEEIGKLSAYIGRAEDEVKRIQIRPRVANRYIFDSVALSIVSKAFSLAKACLTLLETGLSDEAYGLSRSLVEYAINLRYLTQDPDEQEGRTINFATYFFADKAYWLHYALQTFAGEPKEQEIRDYAKSVGIDPDTKAAGRHWSRDKKFEKGFVWNVATCVHPLDGSTTTDKSRKTSYAVDYYQTSLYVHCSQPSVDNYFPTPLEPFQISMSSGEYKRPSQTTIFIVLTNLHSTIAYALFGLGIDRPAMLNVLFSEMLDTLKPVEVIHRR